MEHYKNDNFEHRASTKSWEPYFVSEYEQTLSKSMLEPTLKSIFLKNVLAKTVSHRNLQKLPRYLAFISWGSFCKFLCEAVFTRTFLRKMDFSMAWSRSWLRLSCCPIHTGWCKAVMPVKMHSCKQTADFSW